LAAKRRITTNLPLIAATLVAGLPLISGTVRAIRAGWTPYGDRAVIAVRSFDVFGAHTPAVGQYSQWSALLGRPVFSPGPLLYWLLAIPARLLGATSLPVWMAIVNLACLFGALALARRRGGLGLMAATAVLVPVMCRSLPGETFHDIWNPATVLMPFLLTCFVVWSVAIGEYRLAPLMVLLLSFLVQTHSTYALPGLGLLAIAAAGLATGWHAGTVDRRAAARWGWAAAVVGALCWVAPIVDQLAGSGNLGALVDAARAAHGHVGLAAGWHAVVHAFGIPPWWLGGDISPAVRLADVGSAPGWASQVTCAIGLLALVGALVSGLRARRIETAAVAAISLILAVALGINTAQTPTEDHLALTVSYTLWWASPAGLFAWLTGGWLAAAAVSQNRRARPLSDRIAARRTAWGVATGIAAVAIAGAVAARQPGDSDRGEYQPFATAAGAATAALPHAQHVSILASPPFPGSELEYGLVYALQRRGAAVVVQPAAAIELGGAYAARAPADAAVLDVTYGSAAPAGTRVIARINVPQPAFTPGTFTVALKRQTRAGSSR
jgi:hypothetical protein